MSNKKKNNNYVTDKTTVTKQQEQKVKSSKKTKGVVKQVLLITLAVVLVAGIITGFVFLMRACSKTPASDEYKNPGVAGTFEVTHTVQIKLKGYDNVIEIDLYGKEAPKTVAFLAEALADKSYEGKEITISSNSSDKYVTLTNDKDGNVKGEFYRNDGDPTNNISHVAGVLTMHKTGLAQSSRYDFDILLADTPAKNEYQAAVGFVKDKEDLDFIQKLVDEYRASKTVTETEITELVFGTNSIKVTADDLKAEGKTYKCTYTPKTSATYKFVSDKLTSITILDGENKLTPIAADKKLSDGVEFDLTENKEYTVELGIDGLTAGTTYKLTISGEVFHLGSNTVVFPEVEQSTTEKAAEPREETYKFTAPSTSTYIFKSIDEKVSITVIDGETILDGTKVELEAGKTYSIHMTTTDTEKTSYNVSIYEAVLTVGNNANVDFPKAETVKDENGADKTLAREQTYKFTAEATATYIFKSKDDKVTITILDGETKVGTSGKTVTVELEANKTYNISMSTTDTAATPYIIDITEKTVKAGDNTITIIASDKATGVTYTEYKFAAEKTGTYKFEIFANNGTDVENVKKIAIYKGESYVGEKYAYLIKDEVYTVRIMTDVLSTNTSYNVTVDEPVLVKGENDILVTKNESGVGEDEKTATGKNEVIRYFTATVNGTHVFECTDTDFEVLIYDGDKKIGTAGKADLVKDKEYTIKLVGKETAGTVNKLVQGKTYHINVQEPRLLVDTNEVKLLDAESTFTFETGSDAIYSITAKDNETNKLVIEIYDESGKKMEQDLEYIQLKKGAIYKIKITKPETAGDDFTIIIDETFPVIESVTVVKK